MEEKIRLTQYSHGAGCGCKIAPSVLDGILKSSGSEIFKDAKLLVGNESKDDAAVYDLGDGTAIISTTDFFMPIVDDPLEFGMIASVNAISDVYAMGGTPMMAIAILGWPIDKLSPEIAGKLIEGAKKVCTSCHITLAGGHSIDAPEPIFGLAVTGRVAISNLKQNNTATSGCHLFLTKPLGVGALTTAEKKGILKPQHQGLAASWMKKLNNAGEQFGKLPYVKAMTDVTGFGLLGHLLEMCEGSGLQAEISYEKVPKILEAELYISEGAVPGGTNRNWKSYGEKISLQNDHLRFLLADPQTSGGLLVAVEDGYQSAFSEQAQDFGLSLEPFGRLHTNGLEKVIQVMS